MTIAILTRTDFRSPRVLADSLKVQMIEHGIEAEIFYEIDVLNRMVNFNNSGLRFHFWLIRKFKKYFGDKKLLRELKKFDVIIISECIPNAFSKTFYNVEKFKKIIQKPVGIYEVYYLENAPTQIDYLKNKNDTLLYRYDFHFSVADTTEIKTVTTDKWYSIGLKAESWALKAIPKNEIIAVVDFVQPGYEQYRQIQINALTKAGIKYISLEKPYTIEEIRKIYQKAAIFFVQFPEAFGVPILECLCCGSQIFTPKSGWVMGWRLNKNPKIHGEGILPDCFTVYNNEEQLVKELIAFKENHDLVESPKKVFQTFLQTYPQFYYGNEKEVKRLLKSWNVKFQKNDR